MNRLYYILPALLLLLSSCEKEIDIDYRSVEPIYVVEASVSDDGNKMALHSGDDVVFMITFGEHVSIRVAPWTEVYSDLSI